MLKAVITADIINSRKLDPKVWMPHLKAALKKFGEETKDWEIYRGDSFQLICDPALALRVGIQLKASIMQYKNLNIRMGIGIGEVSYEAKKISESNGTAFIYSGKQFDALAKDETMSFKSPWKDLDSSINLILALLNKLTHAWNPNRALIVATYLDQAQMTQTELGKRLNKQQSNISYSLGKAAYDELIRVLDFYEFNILQRIK